MGRKEPEWWWNLSQTQDEHPQTEGPTSALEPLPRGGFSSRTKGSGTWDDAGCRMEGDRGGPGPEQGAQHGFPSAQETMDSINHHGEKTSMTQSGADEPVGSADAH